MKKNVFKTDSVEGMDFELMLRQFFGDKARFTQDNRENMVKMEKWIKKILEKISSQIDNIDTTTRHKERMMDNIERLKADFNSSGIDPWTIIVHLFFLISRLLGYDYCKANINTPVYFQDDGQYYTQKIFEGGDVMQNYYDKKNLIIIRKNLYKELKNQGHSDFKIAQVLNISEYQIKKLKHNL